MSLVSVFDIMLGRPSFFGGFDDHHFGNWGSSPGGYKHKYIFGSFPHYEVICLVYS